MYARDLHTLNTYKSCVYYLHVQKRTEKKCIIIMKMHKYILYIIILCVCVIHIVYKMHTYYTCTYIHTYRFTHQVWKAAKLAVPM